MTPLADTTLAFGRAMQQWEASLKRPDLDERARVTGALIAYQSQLDACAIVEQRFGDHVTGTDEGVKL